MNLQKYKFKRIFILPAWSVGPSQHKTAEAVFEFIKDLKLIDLFMTQFSNTGHILFYSGFGCRGGVSCVPLFIPNFEPFKIHYFHSHFFASRGPDYFLFLISICFETAFYS